MALDRFRGPNGISQMIALIEAATPERQKILLRSLSLENPGLASLVRTKVLTAEKILSWEPSALSKLLLVLTQEDRLNLYLLSSREPELASNLQKSWSAALGQLPHPAPDVNRLRHADVIEMNLIHRVRELERLGLFSLEVVDPARAA